MTFECRDVAPGVPFRLLFINCCVASGELLSQHRWLSWAPLGELSPSLLVPEQSRPAERRLLLLVNGYGSMRMLPEKPNASLPFACPETCCGGCHSSTNRPGRLPPSWQGHWKLSSVPACCCLHLLYTITVRCCTLPAEGSSCNKWGLGCANLLNVFA